MEFEWDETKNRINQIKHGVSFEEAKTVFYDELHSGNEDRFRILGCSDEGNILLVVHCIREETTIRIISSRKATAAEKTGYKRSVR